MSRFVFWLQRMRKYFLRHEKVHAEGCIVTQIDQHDPGEYKICQYPFGSTWDNANLPQLQLGVPTMYDPSPERKAAEAEYNTCAKGSQLSDSLKIQYQGYLTPLPLHSLVGSIFDGPLKG